MTGAKIDGQARRAARLAAVQALYQMELAGAGAEEVAEEFETHRFGDTPTDAEFFKSIVEGVPQHQAEIDKALKDLLKKVTSGGDIIPEDVTARVKVIQTAISGRR